MEQTFTLTAGTIVEQDLEYICDNIQEELAALAGKHVLLTGGAGFLGYYLIQTILHWNRTRSGSEVIHVTIYDNYMRGIPEWLVQLGDDSCLALVKHDIRRPLPDDVPDVQFIIHAASIASPQYYRKFPIETMDANVNGLRHLLDYSLAQKMLGKPIEGFLFYSTSEIYGDPAPEYIPTPEEYRGNVSCTGPRACYDESKRYGETLCVNFAHQYDLPVKIARPFNNYGPGLKITDCRVIPDFMRDIFAGRDIVMFSDGSPTRTFCYIADAITGYFRVLVRGRSGEAYNIGVAEPEISMAELADRIVHFAGIHLNYRGKVMNRKNPDRNYLTDNPNRRCPVITKAQRELGYNPNISLDEGLERSLLWYTGHTTAEDA